MSTNRLGRAENLDRYWSKNLLNNSSGRVTIKSAEPHHVTPLSVVDRYPYKSQLVITGEFEYGIPGRKEDTVYRTADYEFRTASGLFLIDTSIDRIDPENIISEVNKNVASNAAISSSIQISRENFWDFLNEANIIEELKLRNKDETYDASDLLRVLRSEDIGEKLDEIEREREESIETLREISARLNTDYRPDSLHDLDIDLYSINIIGARATYWYGELPATLIFQNGLLWVDAEDERAREYVIQLFERDVVYPSYED